MMDPIPIVNRFFSVLIQEGRQREISIPSTKNSPIAFNVQRNPRSNQNSRSFSKNRSYPICSQYKRTGHTVDKYYELHGFPPRYRSNQNNPNQGNSRVNVVSDQASTLVNNDKEDNTEGDPITNLTTHQCQQLIVVLTGQLASINFVTAVDDKHLGTHHVLTCESGN